MYGVKIKTNNITSKWNMFMETFKFFKRKDADISLVIDPDSHGAQVGDVRVSLKPVKLNLSFLLFRENWFESRLWIFQILPDLAFFQPPLGLSMNCRIILVYSLSAIRLLLSANGTGVRAVWKTTRGLRIQRIFRILAKERMTGGWRCSQLRPRTSS